MSRRRISRVLVPLLLLTATAPFVLAGRAFVVNRPENLHFVDLKDGFLHVRQRFENRVDLLDHARRFALGRLSRKWGVPQANKAPLAMGSVARVDGSGRLSSVIVMRGALDSPRLEKRLVEAYTRDWEKRGKQANPGTQEVAGHAATLLPYAERPLVDVLVPMGEFFVIGAVPADDLSLVEETVKVLENPESLTEPDPEPVDLEVAVQLTQGESDRVNRFGHRQVDGRLNKIRNKFKALHDKLRSSGAQEEDLKSLHERLNEQFLQAKGYTMGFKYQPGSSEADDLYQLRYTLNFGSPETALAMRELILEQVLAFRENAVSDGILETLDAITVDAQQNAVAITVRGETRQDHYDAVFSYLAFLFSFKEADTFLGPPRVVESGAGEPVASSEGD